MAVHEEWIFAGSFDEKFKNTLRDYFQYGFKNFDSYQAEQLDTLKDDWKRLNNILGDYMEWSESPRQILFAGLDSRSAERNVFQRVYRFCGFREKDPAYFFHALAALSPRFFLRGGLEAMELEKQDRVVHSGRRKIRRPFEPWGKDEDFVLRLEEDLEQGRPLTTAEFLCFYPDHMPLFSGENRKTNLRLQELADLGILHCEQQEGQGKGNHRWSLEAGTLDRLLEKGKAVNPDFEEHFRQAVDFYARYFPLGELGLYVLDRLGADEPSPYRFQHEYDFRALDDYNLADLLAALESRQWCLIRYRHGVTEQETEILCFPLEIRVGTANGRESLMYYDPFLRCYSSLQLKFMDSIQLLEEKQVMEILHVSPELLHGDIDYAVRALSYTWGLSTTQRQPGNAIPGGEGKQPVPGAPGAEQVRLQVAYNPKTERYVRERMEQERRVGRIREIAAPEADNGADDSGVPAARAVFPEKRPEESVLEFSTQVTDTSELRPWLRSFYSRLLSCEGMETRRFSVERDIRDMAEVLKNGALLSRRQEHAGSWFSPGVPVLYRDALRQAAQPAREHEALFHEVFSAYFHVMARVFTRLCAEPEDCLEDAKLNRIIRDALGSVFHMLGSRTEEQIYGQIRKLLLDHGFAVPEEVAGSSGGGSVFSVSRPGIRLKYGSQGEAPLYRDVMPLTRLERRWLRSLAEDVRIGCFLGEAEREVVQDFFKTDRPLPLKRIRYFDQRQIPAEQGKREAMVARRLLEAIHCRRLVWLRYHTRKDTWVTGCFRPVLLEFSRKNNRFQGYFQSCRTGGVLAMNLCGIQDLALKEKHFEWEEAREALERYWEENRKSVEVEFFNVRNLADRLLTELSPWEKRCVYDKSSGKYRLTLFYQANDENELVIRLMGYGPDLRVADPEHSICRAMRERIRRQMEILERQRKAQGRGRKKTQEKAGGKQSR